MRLTPLLIVVLTIMFSSACGTANTAPVPAAGTPVVSPPAAQEPTAGPTETPTATAAPSPRVEPTPTPEPASPEPTPTPTAPATLTATPRPTAAPDPTPTPTAMPTPAPTATPTPVATMLPTIPPPTTPAVPPQGRGSPSRSLWPKSPRTSPITTGVNGSTGPTPTETARTPGKKS